MFSSFFPKKAQDYRHQWPLFPKVVSCDIKINVWLQSLKFCRCYLWIMSGTELWKLKTLYATDMFFHVIAVPSSHWSCPSSFKKFLQITLVLRAGHEPCWHQAAQRLHLTPLWGFEVIIHIRKLSDFIYIGTFQRGINSGGMTEC